MIEIILKLIACAISCDTPTRVSRSRCELSTCLKMMIIHGFGWFFYTATDKMIGTIRNETLIIRQPFRNIPSASLMQRQASKPARSSLFWWKSVNRSNYGDFHLFLTFKTEFGHRKARKRRWVGLVWMLVAANPSIAGSCFSNTSEVVQYGLPWSDFDKSIDN